MINEQSIKELITGTVKGSDISMLASGDDFTEAGLDSLDVATILMAVDEKFGINIPDQDIEQCASIKGIVDYCQLKNQNS
jgi:acyl carrier protein